MSLPSHEVVEHHAYALSSAEASLCYGQAFVLWGGWGERKRERAGHDRPPRAFYFFDGDTQRKPLRRRETPTYLKVVSQDVDIPRMIKIFKIAIALFMPLRCK